MISEYLTQSATEKYKNASHLNDEESKNDPETDPYKSKYKAREIFSELKESIEQMKEESPTDLLTVMTAVLDMKLGVNYSETDETATGQAHLEYCISALEELKLDPRGCNVLQHALNYLGIVWTGRRQPRKALEHLQRAEAIYQDFKHNVGNAPLSLAELFCPIIEEDPGQSDQRRSTNFEDTYTHTMYYLAQVFAQLEDHKKSASYCHLTLQRQLDTMKYEPLDWALNAATLSQYYVTSKNFKLARHCLASATVILKELGDPVTKCEINDEDSQQDVEKKEKLPRSWCDIYRCWSKYGLALMDASKQKLMAEVTDEDNVEPSADDHNADKKLSTYTDQEEMENQDTNEVNEEQIVNEAAKEMSCDELVFNLEVTSAEEQITDKYLCQFEEARAVFRNVQDWLCIAKEFYVLDGHCTDYVEIIQDYSTAFKHLAFYELDMGRQCKMHKRRIDMLQDLLGQLSTQFYMMICRQIMFEIAETYSSMLDLKLAIIEQEETSPSPHAVKKVNALSQQSISHFQTYINTLKNAQKELPDKYAEEDERPALIAYFHMGRLFSKLFQSEPSQQLESTKNSFDMYSYIVTYCQKNPSARVKVATEVEVIEELLQLLPHKMEKLRQRAAMV